MLSSCVAGYLTAVPSTGLKQCLCLPGNSGKVSVLAAAVFAKCPKDFHTLQGCAASSELRKSPAACPRALRGALISGGCSVRSGTLQSVQLSRTTSALLTITDVIFVNEQPCPRSFGYKVSVFTDCCPSQKPFNGSLKCKGSISMSGICHALSGLWSESNIKKLYLLMLT